MWYFGYFAGVHPLHAGEISAKAAIVCKGIAKVCFIVHCTVKHPCLRFYLCIATYPPDMIYRIMIADALTKSLVQKKRNGTGDY